MKEGAAFFLVVITR